MKLLFSESEADYGRYQYPYVVWAVPEPGEEPADIFNAGFLPSARGLGQFCLCRNIRVALAGFKASSENRRILRKGEGIAMKLVPRLEFDLTPARREAYRNYADARYGKDVMPPARLDLVFNSPVATHLLVFTDTQSGADLGVVVLYLEGKRLAFYRYSFYDLNYFNRSLGLFMMTSAAVFFAEQKFDHLYLGTCYSERALYKTQFAGAEFFNGFRWSQDMDELKYLVRRDAKKHLLETPEFLEKFYEAGLEKVKATSTVSVKLR